MYWRPLDIIYVLLGALEGEDWSVLDLILGVPKLDGPIHTSRQHQLRHILQEFGVSFVITHGFTRMHGNFGDRSLVTREFPPNRLLFVLMESHLALINVVVL
jgi:hypothetical protein